ncbi:MAG: peptidoglycan binding domain-containing protein [Candidatus Gastranaerophilales bacterium]|nr:peptidoglycan binding domain-containing protein [Candidatus Gastranaerophilales bacterium]
MMEEENNRESKPEGAQEAQGAKEPEGVQEAKEPEEAQGAKELEEAQEAKEPEEAQGAKEAEGTRETNAPEEAKEPEEAPGANAPEEARGAKKSEGSLETEETKESEESTESKTSHKSGKKRKILYGLLGMGISALIAAYVCGAYYYQSHFFPNTTIEGITCDNLDEIAVEVRLLQLGQDYTLEITGRDEAGNTETIGTLYAEDIDYRLVDVEGAVSDLLRQQNSWTWIVKCLSNTQRSYNLALGVSFDEGMMADKLQQMDAFQSQNMIKPENAYISEYKESISGYEIVPETLGTQLDMDAVRMAVSAAIYGDAGQVDLAEQGCYVTAAVTREDTKLVQNLEAVNRWLAAKIVYDWNGSRVTVGLEQIREWILFQNGVPSLDEEAIADFVAEQAREYDTYGKRRNFITTLGTELSLPGGAYGWKTDRESEIAELIQCIKNGVSEEREPIYSSKGAAKGSNDIGSSYVEADMTNQHLYLYQSGNLVLETDFVSGNMSNGNVTPPGVFGITYKTRNAVLRGADYETPVSYWMPFNGNVGMHDATWRAAFGGDIYLTNGSHGCINLPLDMAAAIYDYMSEGFPVICYYY